MLIRVLNFGMQINRLVLARVILDVLTERILMVLLLICLDNYPEGKLMAVIASVGGTLVEVAGLAVAFMPWA